MITIIILIILAGITLVALSGENGILRQATEAKDKTEQAQLEEEVNLKIFGKQMKIKIMDIQYQQNQNQINKNCINIRRKYLLINFEN